MLRLGQAVTGLAGLGAEQEDVTWWVELGTTERGAVRLQADQDWCLADSRDVADLVLVPVTAVASPLKMQLIIHTNNTAR